MTGDIPLFYLPDGQAGRGLALRGVRRRDAAC